MNITDLDESFLQKAFDCVNQHLDDSSFGQQQFSKEMGVSKSTLYNKLKTLTGLNTSAFMYNIHMKAACRIMDQNRNIRISDLAYAVGFNDPKYFSSCFRRSLICVQQSTWNDLQDRWVAKCFVRLGSHISLFHEYFCQNHL